MAAKKFKFISPGIYTNEVDESIIESTPPVMGPIIIGRTRRGPAMRPITVQNYQEFVEVFGDPVPGPEGTDVWRSDTPTGPTYAAFAAKAWLNADASPATIVRLLGEENISRTSAGTLAGWKTTKGAKADITVDRDDSSTSGSSVGGAFGLWVFDSGSTPGDATTLAGNGTHASGTLAAVWYCDSGSLVMLKGTARDGTAACTGTCVFIASDAADNNFTVLLKNYNVGDTLVSSKEFNFDFDENGGRYIRDVFNTNPVLTNSDVVNNVSEQKNRYWLGETFDRRVKENTTSTDTQFGVILPMISGSVSWMNRQNNFVNPKTGWFISQDFGSYPNYDPPNTVSRLFRFVSRDHGSDGHNFKIAIEDIKASPNATTPYGSFTVAVYPVSAYDTSANSAVLERFTNCNMNPNSVNYVARRVGDKYVSWDYDLDPERNQEIGQYDNKSHYVRIEMNPELDLHLNMAALPFGVTGPIIPEGVYWVSGAQTDAVDGYGGSGSVFTEVPVPKGGTYTHGDYGAAYSTFLTGGSVFAAPFSTHPYGANRNLLANGTTAEVAIACSAAFFYNGPSLRSSSFDGPSGGPGKDAYFGVSATKTKNVRTFDRGFTDYLRGLPFDSTVAGRFEETTGLPKDTAFSWVFSLDDIQIKAATGEGVWCSGSRKNGSSVTAVSSSYKKILDSHNKFWTCMAGGHDGFDITEAEPFRNSQWTAGTTTKLDHYAWNTVNRATDSVSDKDVVECNLITVPGIINNDLTDKVMKVAEDRGDALAIIDLADVFTPSTENTESFSTNLGTLSTVVTNTQTRELETSYGCTYYPWVQIKDTKTSRLLWAPPSVVALGVMASSQESSELWFAPAGFGRGALSKGTAGVPVTAVSEHLSLKQRDSLYVNNINPIAKFPHEGIVVFGQKTLQATESALDRINVRRLLIYLKKEISRMSTEILFDNNVQATWNRFKSLVNPFLASIQTREGLTEYKLVLDETTTTPDLIDRNILYAKIYIKPARAIEFIAVDFIITKTGASFED